jgi:hypothetical protein
METDSRLQTGWTFISQLYMKYIIEGKTYGSTPERKYRYV